MAEDRKGFKIKDDKLGEVKIADDEEPFKGHPGRSDRWCCQC